MRDHVGTLTTSQLVSLSASATPHTDSPGAPGRQHAGPAEGFGLAAEVPASQYQLEPGDRLPL
ncbi:hypothetical protein AB0H88_18795 [Nonomuraea sp. NPDC050680]|uniref:hypothetical protein n=1 Tax=Nonomuraea sp. NPDC050680 TaxID=3154630 RepID=UPI003411F5A6